MVCISLSIICVSSILFIFLFHQVMIIMQVEKALYWLIYICFSVVSKETFLRLWAFIMRRVGE